ncbi:MAG: hypothetical protein II284_04045 [Clostridia bacterium]|nr:hypothetical protein [Clostridia bacterium]MBQ2318792.1 hypothetical protein [Clostridia bacterium]MBQ2420553.1 hypothetical protein [Clostridia bacterium]MBQ5597476.1 hypothetical protein [Clostridia bacterium]
MDNINVTEADQIETEEKVTKVPLLDAKELFCTILVIVMAVGLVIGVILSNWIIGLTAGIAVGVISGAVTLFFRKK